MSPMEELPETAKDTIEPAPEQAALLLRVEDVARRLSLAKGTVYALLASGQLPCVRIGRSVRVPAEQLREWVAERSGQTPENVH
jgi:excisionase family DNA binding protein